MNSCTVFLNIRTASDPAEEPEVTRKHRPPFTSFICFVLTLSPSTALIHLPCLLFTCFLPVSNSASFYRINSGGQLDNVIQQANFLGTWKLTSSSDYSFIHVFLSNLTVMSKQEKKQEYVWFRFKVKVRKHNSDKDETSFLVAV